MTLYCSNTARILIVLQVGEEKDTFSLSRWMAHTDKGAISQPRKAQLIWKNDTVFGDLSYTIKTERVTLQECGLN